MRVWAKQVTIMAITVLVGTLMVPTIASSAVNKADNGCWKYTSSERGFRTKINKERASDGLGKLKLDPELSKVARKHTKEMIQANKRNPNKGLFHSTSEQLRNRVTNWNLIGENVGVGGTVSSLHVAFMGSAPHAANVLHNSYKYVGVGARKGPDGRMWVTIIFEATQNPGTTLRMPSC